MVKAGLQAIYLSGWQVAADANLAGATYPDQSLYPANSVPQVVRRLNNALHARRPDRLVGGPQRHRLARADRRRRRGRLRRRAERVRADARDDRGGRRRRALRGPARGGEEVRPPRRQGARADVAVHPHAHRGAARRGRAERADRARRAHRRAQRDAADDATSTSATRRSSPASGRARASTASRDGLEAAIARSLAYAPYADVLWFETSTPDLGEAREFAQAIHERHPRKLLAYNCSPSFNWRKALSRRADRDFQQQLGEWGYRFQFITLAGFHSLNAGMFELARGYRDRGHERLRRAAGARVRARGRGLHRHASTSARSVRDTSTR